MKITKTDRQYFSIVIDRIHEAYDMASEFVSYNGTATMPAEKAIDLAITEFKTWLVSSHGQSWLGTLGYSFTGFSEAAPTGICPICSGILNVSDYNVCEVCGTYTCSPCSEIVDSAYGIRWCVSCVSGHALTNFQ